MAYFTQHCTGCLETEDGHLVGEYPFDKKARCFVGAGCHECGYTGKRRQYFSIREINKEVKRENAMLERECKRNKGE